MSTYSIASIECPASIKLDGITSQVELEKTTHPKCLPELINQIVNNKHLNFHQWRRDLRILKLANKLPLPWGMLDQTLPFFLNIKDPLKSFDLSWAYTDELSRKPESILSLINYLKSQPELLKEIASIKRSSAAMRLYKKIMLEL